MLGYPLELAPDDNGTLLVTCPDLPEVTTFGEDKASAIDQAVDAIETALASRIADDEPVPAPSSARGRRIAALPALTSAKVELYLAIRAAGVGKAGLASRLGWDGEAVDRLLDINHPSSLAHLEQAFRVLGKRMLIGAKDAAEVGEG